MNQVHKLTSLADALSKFVEGSEEKKKANKHLSSEVEANSGKSITESVPEKSSETLNSIMLITSISSTLDRIKYLPIVSDDEENLSKVEVEVEEISEHDN